MWNAWESLLGSVGVVIADIMESTFTTWGYNHIGHGSELL